jgi:hypothetical protein
MALPHRLDPYAIVLVRLATSRRDHQVGREQKARAPDHPRPKQHIHRVHARSRHDGEVCLDSLIAKRKLLCSAICE